LHPPDYLINFAEITAESSDEAKCIKHISMIYPYQKLEGYHAMLDILKPIHIIRYGAYIAGELKTMSTYYPNNNKAGYRYGR